MFKLLDDASLYEFTHDAPPDHVDALSRLYKFWEERRAPDGSELWLNWVLRERERNELVGHIQAGVGADHADVAWVIGRRWQGVGYASEAAIHLVDWLLALGVREIRASIHPDHLASIRVAERAGLEPSDLSDGDEKVWRLRVADRA
jgi:RimJ/RimL family protein N-acetyltransferase